MKIIGEALTNVSLGIFESGPLCFFRKGLRHYLLTMGAIEEVILKETTVIQLGQA